MKILNATQGTIIASHARRADSFLSRMVGLLDRRAIQQGEGLIISGCRSIHMLFMKFPIDVIFISRQERVVGLLKGIKPFCLSPVFWKAHAAIELPVGVIENSKTSLGDMVRIED